MCAVIKISLCSQDSLIVYFFHYSESGDVYQICKSFETPKCVRP